MRIMVWYIRLHRGHRKKASNGIGFNIDCFTWLNEHYPQDLEKIYAVFPMSERILFEQNYKHDNKE